jgi:hypothetical protein
MTVHWEEEPTKTRVVERYCRVCYPCPLDDEVMLVSPQGIAHHTDEWYGDRTFCGHPATGEEWWWRT